MGKKIQIFKIANSGDENEIKLWDVFEVTHTLFGPLIIFTFINLINEKISFCNLKGFVQVAAYLFLLLGIAICVMKYRNNKGGRFKLSTVTIVEVIKIVLAINSIYFLFASMDDDLCVALTMLAIHISLYLGFAISLDKLLEAETLKDIFVCFKDALPKKGFGWTMLSLCVLFGFLGYYSDKAIILVTIITLGVIFAFLFVFFWWRRKPFDSMCIELKAKCEGKRTLILHAGTNCAFHNKIKQEIEFCESIESLEDNINQYDIVVVLNTFYSDDKKVIIADCIRRFLKNEGIIVDLFVGKEKKRNRIRAWLGVPTCWTEFESIDDYNNVY